jgi:short subunit dehydrogenase-like uncharacterized protein
MTDRLLVYGATGYTGRLILEEALSLGLRPILGGRTPNKLRELAQAHRLSHRLATVDDAGAVSAMLRDVDVLLNAAGPFRTTSPMLASACIERGVHYLDISGEFAVVEALARLGDKARARGVMLMPGTGFDVVPSDCMAALVARRLPDSQSLSIALSGLNAISRGSAETVFVQYGELVMVRRGGRLVRLTPGELTRDFDFGEGPRRTTAITWADVASAYYTTGVPNITVYYEATPIVEFGLALNRYGGWLLSAPGWEWWRRAGVRMLPEGPTFEERRRGQAALVVEAVDASRRSVTVRLRTPEVYSFTAVSSVDIADRVLGGDFEPGFQTPARVYGPEYVLSLPGVTYSELPEGAQRRTSGQPPRSGIALHEGR